MDGFRRHLASAYGPAVGRLAVRDTELTEAGRQAASGAAVEVVVVTTGGAGALLSLARRRVAGLEIGAVTSALRDLDDLTAAAARVASAAGALDPEVEVYVELPHAPGWEGAAAEVEAAGLLGQLRSAEVHGLAEQLSVLVELDLPFRVGRDAGGPGSVGGPSGLLVAVAALVDGAAPDDAAALLAQPEATSAEVVRGWAAAEWTRVRRRVRRIACADVAAAARHLPPAGTVSGGDPPAGSRSR